MRKATRVILGGLAMLVGAFVAAFSILTVEVPSMVSGLGLVVGGSVILMDGLL
jgi:hypothetical protein